MTNMFAQIKRQKEQKERACKQRFVVMPSGAKWDRNMDASYPG